MTLFELSQEIDYLALKMRSVAALMEYYGGFNPEVVEHAKELDRASDIARGWAKGIRKNQTKEDDELH